MSKLLTKAERTAVAKRAWETRRTNLKKKISAKAVTRQHYGVLSGRVTVTLSNGDKIMLPGGIKMISIGKKKIYG